MVDARNEAQNCGIANRCSNCDRIYSDRQINEIPNDIKANIVELDTIKW